MVLKFYTKWNIQFFINKGILLIIGIDINE